MGEEGAAFVRGRAGESITDAEIIDYCKIHIARHTWPEHRRFVAEFHTTPSGRISKFELRDMLIKELAAGE